MKVYLVLEVNSKILKKFVEMQIGLQIVKYMEVKLSLEIYKCLATVYVKPHKHFLCLLCVYVSSL